MWQLTYVFNMLTVGCLLNHTCLYKSIFTSNITDGKQTSSWGCSFSQTRCSDLNVITSLISNCLESQKCLVCHVLLKLQSFCLKKKQKQKNKPLICFHCVVNWLPSKEYSATILIHIVFFCLFMWFFLR